MINYISEKQLRIKEFKTPFKVILLLGNINKKSKKELPSNKWKLQMSTSVSYQHITYHTDSNILNQSRNQSGKIICKLYKFSSEKGEKLRKYRRIINSNFLS